MKRLITFFLLFIISVLLPIGCAGSNSTAPSPSSSQTVLSLYNYSTYTAPETIAQFEKQFGVKIKEDNYESSDALYAKLQSGNPGYDVIFPADYMVKIMASKNMLEPLKLANIPNRTNLDPKFVNQAFDPGNQYSMPYQWGTMGIGYNTKKVQQEIKSWSVMFDPKFNGKTAWPDDGRYTLAGALIYLGFDPNTTKAEEINKARDLIVKSKDKIAAFTGDTGQNLLAQGEVSATVEWSGDVFQVMSENPDLRYAIPQEGSIIFTDNMAIPKGAPHKELAEKFINFILEPEVGAKVSNFIHFGSPNKVARERGLIDKKDLENPQIYPPAAVFEKLKFIQDVGSATTLYDKAWTEVKAAMGK